MKILAIETTGHFASVALMGKQIKNDTDYSHLEEIIPMCMEILKECSMDGKDLDAIAVSKGPGSFTGIRIGLATAKGLAQVWNKPIIAVPTLESFAYRNLETVAPIFDARRDQVYAAVYKAGEPLIESGAYDISEFKEKLESFNLSDVHFFGDGASLMGKEAEGAQEASQVLVLAEKMFESGNFETCYSAKPEYLRLAEAERKLKEKQK